MRKLKLRKLKFLNAKLLKGGRDFESKLSICCGIALFQSICHSLLIVTTNILPWISFLGEFPIVAGPKGQRWPWRWDFRAMVLVTGRTGFGIKADWSQQENSLVTSGTSLGACAAPAFTQWLGWWVPQVSGPVVGQRKSKRKMELLALEIASEVP